jgi:hypothetical protein
MWIFVGLGIVGAIAAAIGWSQGRDRGNDLGGVSNLWLAEHRHSETQEPRR